MKVILLWKKLRLAMIHLTLPETRAWLENCGYRVPWCRSSSTMKMKIFGESGGGGTGDKIIKIS